MVREGAPTGRTLLAPHRHHGRVAGQVDDRGGCGRFLRREAGGDQVESEVRHAESSAVGQLDHGVTGFGVTDADHGEAGSRCLVPHQLDERAHLVASSARHEQGAERLGVALPVFLCFGEVTVEPVEEPGVVRGVVTQSPGVERAKFWSDVESVDGRDDSPRAQGQLGGEVPGERLRMLGVTRERDRPKSLQVEQPQVSVVALTDAGEQRVRREHVLVTHGRVEIGGPVGLRSNPRFRKVGGLGQVQGDRLLADLDGLEFGQLARGRSKVPEQPVELVDHRRQPECPRRRRSSRPPAPRVAVGRW